MDIETFQGLPTEAVAQMVREAGPQVCVFPINGTRRWFVLEHPEEAARDPFVAYLDIAGRRHVELYQMFFDHGVDTLLTPVFGPDLLERGDEYRQLAVQGLLWFAQNPAFTAFYDAYDVRVRVYGDYEPYFQRPEDAHLLDVFAELMQSTASHRRHRLFFGVCAHDATETIARIGIQYHERHGRPPGKREIVETYYGEYVDPVSFFIGFDRFAAFDMPLITTGDEDLYFTVSPSPYLDQHALRAILYDHMFSRRMGETDYADLSPADWQVMANFYFVNRTSVQGVGCRHASGDFWYPLPQVRLPPELEKCLVES